MEDKNMTVSIEEQEICINAMRDEKFATIYASDSTYITKLDKLCKESPDMYSLIEDTGRGKKYLLKDKTLISFRAKKTTRVMTDEQKKASAERLRKARENKSVFQPEIYYSDSTQKILPLFMEKYSSKNYIFQITIYNNKQKEGLYYVKK